MNWKSTLLLVTLAAGAGVWLFKGDEWFPKLAPRPAAPDSAALASVETDLTPEAITRVEVLPGGGEPFVLEKGPAGWSQPGNWPLRAAEANELVATLAGLRTRFRPVPLPDGEAAAYGVAASQKPIVVKVKANGTDYTLTFGEPKPGAGDTAFTKPAFVRVNDAPEVLKLGPDVMPVLHRPAEAYRRRQLFADVERVKLPGTPAPAGPGAPPAEAAPTTVSLPGEGIEEVRVTGKSVTAFGFTPWFLDGRFALKRTGPTPPPAAATKGAEPVVQPDRLADAWELSAPVRERAEPARLQQVLAAVPELWVEDFVPTAQGALAEHPFAIAQLLPVPLEPFPGLLTRLHPETVTDPREGLKKSKESVTVRLKSGTAVTVKFGGTAKTVERDEQLTIPNPMGGPPRTITQKVPTPYRYAQIEGNPQLFTVSADKLNGLFVKAGEVADARVARFAEGDVQTITVTPPGKAAVTLMRKKGSPKAAKDEDRQDRWLIDQQPNPVPADPARVEDLLGKLAGFRGATDTDLYKADPKARGLDPASATLVTITAREKRPEGEPEAPAREYKLLIGTPDFTKGTFPAQLAGWPRVALIDDRVPGAADAGWLVPKLFPERLSAQFARPAVVYRGRKLLDTADAKLVSVSTDGPNGFAIKKEKAGERDVWKLTAPIASDADPANVANLLNQLTGLQAAEFVAEKTASPAGYGLDKPKLTVQFRFDDERTYKLEVGGPRPGKKDEVFARLDGGDVFALAVATRDALAAGPVGLLPLQVWLVPPDKVTAAEITRPDAPADSFALTKDGTNWKLTGPFAAPVPFLNAQPMLTGVGTLAATKYEALAAADPAKYGFDKPLLKVKLTYTEKAGDAEKSVTKAAVIGGTVPGGTDRYAKFDEPNAPVFVVPAAYLANVQVSPLGLLDRNLLFLDAAKITKVQIDGDTPDSTVTLTKDDKGKWAAAGAAFTVDTVAAGQLVSQLAPLPVERLAGYGDAVKWADYGLDKPAVTVTVTLGGEKPETHKLQIGKPDPIGGRFVRVDGGKAVGVIPPAAVPQLVRTKLEFADRTLLTFDPATLNGFARTKGKEELELAPAASGTGWDVVKPAKLKADQPLLDELADQLGRLRAEKVAAFGKKADVFKEYGLEPPEASVTLTVGEKAEQKVLRLGRPVDAKKPELGRYAAVEGAGADATVGVLPAALAGKLLAPAVSFRDRAMVKFVDADLLRLERGPRKVTFAKVNGTWKVTAPGSADAEQAPLDDLVNELAKLRAADWVAEAGADLKPFGLDKPEATWTVTNGDKVEAVLHVGKAAPDGRVYARVGSTGPVALLGRDQTAKVLAEYRVRKPWTLDAFQAEKLEFTQAGKTFTLQKDGAAWADPAAPKDIVSAPAVTELLGGLTALQVERYAVDEKADLKLFGLEKPEAALTVTFKDGSKRELAVGGVVGGTGDKQRYARVVDKDRTDVFVLSAADTDRLTRARGVYVQKK
ncbi:DUF4340 domain-containing protein [Gemmata sp. JC673]|uniref:DUF4340 domain-containing protein n=1 Tax=Gemmata algarum TaxID=2975278 RepID=A0ABU5FBB0_9BACT|nr:DUF4340 domain-containing protein [Gemmata algarum]MDY3563698.1 DUF4340 domain-containing protein [Gemmata algarum]